MAAVCTLATRPILPSNRLSLPVAILLVALVLAVSGCSNIQERRFSTADEGTYAISLNALQRMVFITDTEIAEAPPKDDEETDANADRRAAAAKEIVKDDAVVDVNAANKAVANTETAKDHAVTDANADAKAAVKSVRAGQLHKRRVICAEPSPDVFTALAASLSGGAGAGGQNIGAAASMAQSAAALGPRTQTIQLLRDGLYRACEAYMNGLINRDEYRQIMFAYDEVMITMIAVDGLNYALPVLQATTEGAGLQQGKEDKIKTAPKVQSTAELNDVKGQANPPGVATTSASPAIIASHGDDPRHQIVRDYYCFQLIMKKAFYKNEFAEIGNDLIKMLCPK